MLIDKNALLQLIDSLPDATPAVSPDPIQVQLDAANAQLASVQAALATDDAEILSDADAIAKLTAKIAAIKSALEA